MRVAKRMMAPTANIPAPIIIGFLFLSQKLGVAGGGVGDDGVSTVGLVMLNALAGRLLVLIASGTADAVFFSVAADAS